MKKFNYTSPVVEICVTEADVIRTSVETQGQEFGLEWDWTFVE